MDSALRISPLVDPSLSQDRRAGKEEKPAQDYDGRKHFHGDASFLWHMVVHGGINSGSGATACAMKKA
jgi:hypothetical protein